MTVAAQPKSLAVQSGILGRSGERGDTLKSSHRLLAVKANADIGKIPINSFYKSQIGRIHPEGIALIRKRRVDAAHPASSRRNIVLVKFTAVSFTSED